MPLLMELGGNADDRAVLKLLSTPVAIGRPVFSTPDVPADRVKALRAAFDATMKDRAFLEEAHKANLEINPVAGDELQRIVADIIRMPQPITRRLGQIMDEK